MQSLKCFEKVNNYDIEYKLQSRICFIVKLQVIMQEKKSLKIITFHIMSEVAIISSAHKNAPNSLKV